MNKENKSISSHISSYFAEDNKMVFKEVLQDTEVSHFTLNNITGLEKGHFVPESLSRISPKFKAGYLKVITKKTLTTNMFLILVK